MDWKRFFYSRGFRDGLCIILLVALLAGLWLPGGHMLTAKPESPLEDVAVQDIEILKVGESLSEMDTIMIPNGGVAQPTEPTEETDPEETEPEETEPEETESDGEDVGDGEEGQEDGSQGEEGTDPSELDLAMVMTWYRYGKDASTITCAPSDTVSSEINTAQLVEESLKYRFKVTGKDAKKLEITSVTVTQGNAPARKIEESGTVAVELPPGNESRIYTFQVTAKLVSEDLPVTFDFVLEFSYRADLELELTWTKADGKKKTVSCQAEDTQAIPVQHYELADGRFEYRMKLIGTLADNAQITKAEYRSDSGESGELDKRSGSLTLRPTPGSDSQTYQLTVTAKTGDYEITYRFKLVYREILDVRMKFTWFERGSLERIMTCRPGEQTSEIVCGNQLSAGALPYEITLEGSDGTSGRITRVSYSSTESGGGDLPERGALPMSLPEGCSSNVYTVTVQTLVKGQEQRFEAVFTFRRDISLEMRYEILENGTAVPRIVICENGKTIQAEPVYTDQLTEDTLAYTMQLTGAEERQTEITSVQCYRSADARMLTLEPEGDLPLKYGTGGTTGENTFTVKAADSDGTQYTFTVNIPYKPRGSNCVKIETNLRDGDLVINDQDNNLTVEAWSEDASGNILDVIPANGTDTTLRVTLDGEELYYVSSSGRKSEYTLVPKNPEMGDSNTHTLHIYAEDAFGNYGEKTITLTGQRAMNGQVRGSAKIYVDLTVLGLGVQGPVDYTVLAGEPVSYVVAKAVFCRDTGSPFGAAEETFGWSGTNSGTLDVGFYLESITTGLDANTMEDSRWPGSGEAEILAEIDRRFGKGTGLATLWRCLYRNGLNKSSGSGSTFGEFDYTSGSGWVYSIGSETYYPGQSMSDVYLQDQDTLTLRYTLAYGWDVGGGTEGYGNTIGYCVTGSGGSFRISHRMETVENPDETLTTACRCCGLVEDCSHEHTKWIDLGDGTHISECEDCRNRLGDPQEHTWDLVAGSRNHTCILCESSQAHRWQDVENTDTANCTQPGTKKIRCIHCTLEEEAESEPRGHALANTWYHNADGHWQKCQVCGDIGEESRSSHEYRYDESWDDFLCRVCDASHEWDYCGNNALEQTGATCLRIDYRCPDCGMETFREGIFAEYHDYRAGVCTHCGGEDPDYAPHEHDYVEQRTEATCTEDGLIVYTCSCGDSFEEVIPAAHAWGEWETTLEPTEEAEGEECRTCENCAQTQTRTLDKLEHSHSYDTVVSETPASCTEEGSRETECRCGDRKTETLEALGHDWSDWEITLEPTEETEGEKTRECGSCGKTQTKTLDKLVHEHTYDETERKDHTNSEDGFVVYTCPCGDSYEDLIPAGHEWSKWKKNEEKGTKTRTCSVCGKKQTKDLEE